MLDSEQSEPVKLRSGLRDTFETETLAFLVRRNCTVLFTVNFDSAL